MPLHKLQWLPTRQPVVTDLWKTRRAPAKTAVFTSIANWSTSGLKDINWRGEKYLWSKSREFLRFVAAPKKSGEPFELATDIKDEQTRDKFLRNGWRFRGPHEMSVDYWQYRDYIRRSKGEFTVAKDQYVRLHTGWFSDRSACYLAAGRPVITQETGFTDHYGNDGGLFAFRSLGEIAEAVREINADYKKHSRAARAVAQEVFEAEVLDEFSIAPASRHAGVETTFVAQNEQITNRTTKNARSGCEATVGFQRHEETKSQFDLRLSHCSAALWAARPSAWRAG